MSSNPQYSELANWDGKLAGTPPSTAADSAGEARTPSSQQSSSNGQSGSASQSTPTMSLTVPQTPTPTSSESSVIERSSSVAVATPSPVRPTTPPRQSPLRLHTYQKPTSSGSLSKTLRPVPITHSSGQLLNGNHHPPPNAQSQIPLRPHGSPSTKPKPLSQSQTPRGPSRLSITSEGDAEDMLLVDSMLNASSSSTISSTRALSPSKAKVVSEVPTSEKRKAEAHVSQTSPKRNWGLSSSLPPSSPEKPSEGDPPTEFFNSPRPTLVEAVEATVLQTSNGPGGTTGHRSPVDMLTLSGQPDINKLKTVLSNEQSSTGLLEHIRRTWNPSSETPIEDERDTRAAPTVDQQEGHQEPPTPSKSRHSPERSPVQFPQAPSTPIRNIVFPASQRSPIPLLRREPPRISSPTALRATTKPLSHTKGTFSHINTLIEDENLQDVSITDEVVMADLASVPNPRPRDRASQAGTSDQSKKAGGGRSSGRRDNEKTKGGASSPLLRAAEPPSPLTTISSSSSPLRMRVQSKSIPLSHNKGGRKDAVAGRVVFAGVIVPPFPRGVNKKDYVDLGGILKPHFRPQTAVSKLKKQTVSRPQTKPDLPVPTSHVKAQSVQAKKKRRASTVPSIEPPRKKARATVPSEAPHPVYEVDDDDETENQEIELVTNGVEGLDPFADLLVSQQIEILGIGDNFDSLRWTLVKMQRDLPRRVDGAPKSGKKTRRVEVWIEGEEGTDRAGVTQDSNLMPQPRVVDAVSARTVKKSQKSRIRPNPSKSTMGGSKESPTRELARLVSDGLSPLPQLTSSPRPEVSLRATQPSSHPTSLPFVSPFMTSPSLHEGAQSTRLSPGKSTSKGKTDPPTNQISPKPITPTQRSTKKRTSSYTGKVVVDKDTVGDMRNFTTSNVPDFVSLSPVTTPPAEVEQVAGAVIQPLDLNSLTHPPTPVCAEDQEAGAPWDEYHAYFSDQAQTEQAALHDPSFFMQQGSRGQPLVSSSMSEVVEVSFHRPNGVGPLGVYGNGTIDPSLICGPHFERDEDRGESRSGTPTSSASSVTRNLKAGEDVHFMRRDVDGEKAGSGGGVWEFRSLGDVGDTGKGEGKKRGTGAGKGKGKGKGKEKVQEKEVTAAIRALTAENLGDKRRRKPSMKLREASRSASVADGSDRNEIELTDADADGSTVTGEEELGDDGIKVSVKTDPPRKRQPTKYNPKLLQALESGERLSTVIMKELAEEPTTCHQCRRRTIMEKMRCTIVNPGGPCGKRFCINCILKRYPDIRFDPYAVQFECPCCGKRCNCTKCSRDRGEEYVPQSRKRVTLPKYLLASASQLSLSSSPGVTPITGKSRGTQSVPPSTPTATKKRKATEPPTPSVDLPEGSFWGTVYGPDGRAYGKGFVGDDSQQIVIRNEDEPPPQPLPLEPLRRARSKKKSNKPQPVEYIGLHRDQWHSTVSLPPSLPTTLGSDDPPGSRAYIGRRVTLFDKSYKSLDEHIAFAIFSAQRQLPPPPFDSPPKSLDLRVDSSPMRPNSLDGSGEHHSSDPPARIPEETMGFLLASILIDPAPPNQETLSLETRSG